MESGAGGGAGPGDIAAVLGDFRLMEHHVEQAFSPQSKPFGTVATLLYCKTVIKSTQKFDIFHLLQYYKKKSSVKDKFVGNLTSLEALPGAERENEGEMAQSPIDNLRILCNNIWVKL